MVVATILWPSRSRTVRMSYPWSSNLGEEATAAVVGGTHEMVPKPSCNDKPSHFRDHNVNRVRDREGALTPAGAGRGARVLPERSRSRKQCRQNIGNKINQAVTDHVGDQVAAPQIESGQD
jgi:hypothetical protein